MKNSENQNVFIVKVHQRINEGMYDHLLTKPFMTRELLFYSIKTKFDTRVESGGTPILSDAEIKDAISAATETVGYTTSLFLKHKILIIGKDGKYEFSDIAKRALRW